MAVLKRNLWTLFWLILLAGTILMIVILNSRWHSIYSQYEIQHKNRAMLVAQSIDSVLRTQELVLDVVGRELINTEQPVEASAHLPLLDHILAVDKVLLGFGLANPDGRLVRVSSNLDLSRLPNLRTDPKTKDSFELALQSDAMVLGRTYLNEALNDWIIPVRKALRDESGQVLAVMTAGLRISSEGSLFDQKLYDGPYDRVILYREADNYAQFVSQQDSSQDVYTHPWATPEQRIQNRRDYEAQLGMTEAEVLARHETITIRTERLGHSYLTAAIFNNRYQIWVLSETRLTPIGWEFTQSAGLYLLIFFIMGGVLFMLFRVIARAEMKRHQDLLYHSTHDDLTGVLNRSGLLNQLGELMLKKQPFSLVLINIDNFRGINDRFGQNTGDATLIEFSRRLQTLLDDDDDLTRLGSDEFAITTPSVDLVHLETACLSLMDQLSSSFEVGPLRLQLTSSVGVATYPSHGDSSSKLIRSAHLALYKAKNNRNSVSIYHTEMEMAYLRRLTVEQRLRQALSNQQLHMAYQPQVDERGQTVGLEALVRWQDDELGFVSPAEFVEVAEQSGLMITLGRFVLDTSLREYSALRSELGRSFDLAINISVIQFEQNDFVEEVLKILRTWNIPPQELVLEITESLIMTNFDQMLHTIQRLRHEGIRLSMDDFGTGFSSLSLLRKLPIDELKIDKTFVDSLQDDTRAANMIQSIIHIASTHGMDVVVEGVELEAQASALIRMGCRRLQGYYFYRPERIERIREILSSEKVLETTL